MTTNTNVVAVSTVSFEERSMGFARLIASFRDIVFKSESQPKDQAYADYLETMAVLTGF